MSLSGMVEIPGLQAKRKFVMPANAGIQVTDSVCHTVGKRHRGDDKAGMTAIRVDFQLPNSEPLGFELRVIEFRSKARIYL